jgi:hypothetical protein
MAWLKIYNIDLKHFFWSGRCFNEIKEELFSAVLCDIYNTINLQQF